MTRSPALPMLTFYARQGCHLCDEARDELQFVLEERVKRGEPIARVHVIDVDSSPELKQKYNDFVPVIALNGVELPLVMGRLTIERFLDRTLGRLA